MTLAAISILDFISTSMTIPVPQSSLLSLNPSLRCDRPACKAAQAQPLLQVLSNACRENHISPCSLCCGRYACGAVRTAFVAGVLFITRSRHETGHLTSLHIQGNARDLAFGVDGAGEDEQQRGVRRNASVEVGHHSVFPDERQAIERRITRVANHLAFVVDSLRLAENVRWKKHPQ